MSPTRRRLLIIISAALLSALPPPATAIPSTAYEVLESHGFPAGLLPKGVTKYELDESTGQFSVYFNKTCRFIVNRYELKLQSKISGAIFDDEIRNLEGVQVLLLVSWADIILVRERENGEELEFTVGNASASFPVYYFYESPECGCGFDCVNSGAGNRSRKVGVDDQYEYIRG